MRYVGWVAIGGMALLAGCVEPVPPTPPGGTSDAVTASSADVAARRFVAVVETVEPVAERYCRAQSSGLNCDFKIAVDSRPGQPPNAFQSLDERGRPVIAFTLSMIADVRNDDELAFVLSHEAAHHIRRHLARQRVNATAGATVFGQLAQAAGAGGAGVELATQIGASVGARSYSKEFELEADSLGARIAQAAGYDPIRGAQYFTRIPDPGDRFLGTHPPNANRIETVRRAVGG